MKAPKTAPANARRPVTVGDLVAAFFHAQRDYDPLPALRGYGGPRLSVVTPTNDAPFGLHNIDTDLPHTTIIGTGHWLQMDGPEEFDRLLDRFLDTTVNGEEEHDVS